MKTIARHSRVDSILYISCNSSERQSMSNSIEIYDSTLRDGAQAEGISYSLEDKILIARRIDLLGVHYIEGGWPNPTNPKDLAFFKEVKKC